MSTEVKTLLKTTPLRIAVVVAEPIWQCQGFPQYFQLPERGACPTKSSISSQNILLLIIIWLNSLTLMGTIFFGKF
jgi:hypothetical protein